MAPILEADQWPMLGREIDTGTSEKSALIGVGVGMVTFGAVAFALLVAIACACGKGEDDGAKDGKVRKALSSSIWAVRCIGPCCRKEQNRVRRSRSRNLSWR